MATVVYGLSTVHLVSLDILVFVFWDYPLNERYRIHRLWSLMQKFGSMTAESENSIENDVISALKYRNCDLHFAVRPKKPVILFAAFWM